MVDLLGMSKVNPMVIYHIRRGWRKINPKVERLREALESQGFKISRRKMEYVKYKLA